MARDILALLERDLPDEMQTIHQQHQAKKYDELLKTVHKLHGAVCYAGTPRLKTVLAALETQLKTHIMDGSSSLLDLLDTEVSRLLEQISEHNKQLTR